MLLRLLCAVLQESDSMCVFGCVNDIQTRKRQEAEWAIVKALIGMKETRHVGFVRHIAPLATPKHM